MLLVRTEKNEPDRRVANYFKKEIKPDLLK